MRDNTHVLTVTCSYPVPKEYLALPITDEEMMEIAFAVVTPPRYSLEIYIDASVENPPRIGVYPKHQSGLLPSNV